MCLQTWHLCESSITNTTIKWLFTCVDSLVCLQMCWPVKIFPQTSQQNGLSPECTLICSLSSPCTVNLLPQTSQPKCFSPVWNLMCVVRFASTANSLPQTSQTDVSMDRMASLYLDDNVYVESAPNLWREGWPQFRPLYVGLFLQLISDTHHRAD